jgi:hypothetical protein
MKCKSCNNIATEDGFCAYHKLLEQYRKEDEEKKVPSEFAMRLKAVDGGKFSKIIDSINVSNSCENCYSFNPTITDNRLGTDVMVVLAVLLQC